MTRYIFIAFSFFSLSGCKGEMEFKKVESSSKNRAPEYYEVFLVANAPTDKTLRDSLLVEFAKENMPDFCSLDPSFNSYSIFFYESTWCTRSFDKRNLGNGWALAMDEEGCPEDKLRVFFWYKRSETNPNNWHLYLPEIPADTIYCEQSVFEKISFHLWDHFGLDLPDLQKWFNLIGRDHLKYLAFALISNKFLTG